MCAAGLVGDCSFFGVAFDWLLTLVRVPLDEKEPEVSNDVAGDFCGDLGCPGLLFCNFTMPESLLVPLVPVGDRDVALLCGGVRLFLS